MGVGSGGQGDFAPLLLDFHT